MATPEIMAKDRERYVHARSRSRRRSKAKVSAAKANGAKGGRPRKRLTA